MAAHQVAIACQGGGTHAAFTWGVLEQILSTMERFEADPGGGDTFRITAVSGTSSGALCALATWYGLAPNLADRRLGSAAAARERLEHLWSTFAATTPAEVALNRWAVGAMRLHSTLRLPAPGLSPGDPLHRLSLAGLAAMGVRPEYLGFSALLEGLCPDLDGVDWAAVARRRLRLIAGAVEVVSGNDETFDSEASLEERGLAPGAGGRSGHRWRIRRPLSLEGIAASGTLPQLLPAQAIADLEFPGEGREGTVRRTGHYWDGLHSQNPPVADLLDQADRDAKPDEIWVIRINPQQMLNGADGGSPDDIQDRQNDLAGNLALNRELDRILSINRWLERHGDGHPPLDACKPVRVRTIRLPAATARTIGPASKMDRDRDHLERLRREGRAVAHEWLAAWRAGGQGPGEYPDDLRHPRAAGRAARATLPV